MSNTIGNTPVGATGAPASNASSSSATGVDKLANEQTFLQLFVSQLKNQDPLNPADGTQFVTQLAQFSQLEQTLSTGSDIKAIRGVISPDPATVAAQSGS